MRKTGQGMKNSLSEEYLDIAKHFFKGWEDDEQKR